MIRKYVLGILAITVLILFISSDLFAEYIFLKNGSIIKGRIVSETASSISFAANNNKSKTKNYQRSNIMRILYTDLYMGQQYIRLTDGKVIQAYMVDQDRTTFTFRKKLYKPVEFKIARKKILFMARKNPNELKGESDYTSIDIVWQPPLGTIKKYNIYITKKYTKFPKKPSGTTTKATYTLKNLKGSTDYSIIVTAIDDNGKESLPSNELNIMTKNLAPGMPSKLKCLIVNNYGKKMAKASLEWKASVDPDGEIASYHIYLKKGNDKYILAHKLKISESDAKNEFVHYELKGLKDKTEYTVKIKAIDKKNAESPMSRELSFSTRNKLPNSPRSVAVSKQKYKGGKTIDGLLIWQEAKDSDGTITSYRIYQKTKRGAKLLGSTKNLKYSLKLMLDTDYVFEVRAVDNRNGESEDNKIVKISTFNIKPNPPTRVNKKKIFSKDKKRLTLILTWSEAKDPDGKIVKYIVYLKTGVKRKKIGTTTKTTYTIKNLNAEKKYSVYITSVDNRGSESADSHEFKPGKIQFDVSIRPAALIPLRNFADITKIGTGSIVSFSVNNLFVKNLNFAIEGGFFYFWNENSDVNYFHTIPFFFTISYEIKVVKSFYITPKISAGGSYNVLNYNYLDPPNAYSDFSDKSFYPLISGGLTFSYIIKKRYILSLGAEYMAIIAPSNVMDFMNINIGFGMRFAVKNSR